MLLALLLSGSMLAAAPAQEAPRRELGSPVPSCELLRGIERPICEAADAQALAAELKAEGVDCDNAMTTYEMNRCWSLSVQRETARMEQYLAVATERAYESDRDAYPDSRTSMVAWLTASQRSWKTYMEINCDGVLDQFASGSIRAVMYLGCVGGMTRERTHQIWNDHLTFMDSSDPVLPEPVADVTDVELEAIRRPAPTQAH